MPILTSPRLVQLAEDWANERARLYKENNARLWAYVKDLDKDDLKDLENLIHEHLHGDGEDD